MINVESISKTYKTYIKGDNILSSLIYRKYKQVRAVKDISFSVNEGEILGMVGLNGAGKTSVIKLVSGIMKPDSGKVNILEENPFNKSKNYRNNVALIMGQNNQLNSDLSLLDNVLFIAAIYGISKADSILRAKIMSEKLMLSEDDMLKQVRIMSLGQKMKGELILSFIHLPQIVFLDEPTLGLDFMAQSAVRSFLLDYVKEQRASILLTSHYIKDIEELCERIVILNKGESIYYGTVSDLKRKASAVELDTIVENMYRESG